MEDYTQSISYKRAADGSIVATLALKFPNGTRRVFVERYSGEDVVSDAHAIARAEGAPVIAGLIGAAAAAPMDPAHWWWKNEQAALLGKSVNDEAALQAWWGGMAINSRAQLRAMFLEGPPGSPAKKRAWWGALGKKRRKLARERHGKGGGFDLGKLASSAVDVVTLRPIAKHIPLVRDVHSAVTNLQKLPLTAARDVLSGKRLDRVAVGQFKSALASAKTIAPYAQTVIALVPGVGAGLAGAIGAGLALAEGKSITDALIAAARGALPGGALAAAAFDVAAAVAQGKPIEQAALAALPIDDKAKRLLVEGAKAARGLASGKRVDAVLLDTALKALPAAAGKAAQVGIALGAGKALQAAGLAATKQLAAGKVLAAAAESLKRTEASPLGSGAAKALQAASRLARGGAARSLGAPTAAAKMARLARTGLGSSSAGRAAFELAKRTGRDVAKPAPAKPPGRELAVIAAARAGKLKSNKAGKTSPAELQRALSSGRVFFVGASA